MTIELNSITSGYSVSLVNANFQKLEKYLNESLLNRANVETGQPNQMEVNLDMNGHSILNAAVDTNDINSLLTIEVADSRYVSSAGDTLEGPLLMGGQPIRVRVAQLPDEPARKDELDSEVANRQQADSNIQDQLSGGAPLEASAFSPISWHAQSVNNSVTIPNNQNAWSFGPTMTIASGQSVIIGQGSYWTVANGEGDQINLSYDGGTL